MSDDPNEERDVVTVFLRNGADVLLLRRSEGVGSYAGKWGAVAGHAEGAPDALARAELAEETGLLEAAAFVRRGDPFTVKNTDLGTRWIVHPYLFDCASREVTPNYETTEWAWVTPTEILERDTVPDLWTSYARVAPSVATIREDREHGSAYLSYRALEVLRDRAAASAAGRAEPERPDDAPFTGLARELLSARPSMAVLETRVNRAIYRAEDAAPATVRDAAEAVLREALNADSDAAREAARTIRAAGGRVLTLSRSGTVLDALREGAEEVVVCESRPGREGVDVAETLSEDCAVTLCIDAAVAHELEDIDAVLVGADAVLADGRVINKIGTRTVAAVAAREDVPVFVACAGDKVRAADDHVDLEPRPAHEVYDGGADVVVDNPTFDVTPADLVTVVTEDGRLDAGEIRQLADSRRRFRRWRDG